MIVYAVHGTFQEGARWARPGGILHENLVAVLGHPITWRAFTWTGRNAFGSRRRAAVSLARELRRSLRAAPTEPHFVVAHSHGGNVAFRAARAGKLDGRLAGIVCLATPFLNLRRRRASTGAVVGMVIALGFLGLLPMNLWLGSGIMGDGLLVGVLTIGAVHAATILVGLQLLGHMRDRTAHALRRNGIGPLTATPCLVVRAPWDEALGGLGSVHSPLSIVTAIWTWVANLLWVVLLAGPWRVLARAITHRTRRGHSVWPVVLVSILGVVSLKLYLGTSREALFAAVFSGAMMVVAYGGAVLLLLGVVSLVLWAVSALLSVSVGFELAPLYPTLELGVEATPPGRCDSHLLLESRPGHVRGLDHSFAYQSHEAAGVIADLLVYRGATDRMRHDATGEPGVPVK